MTTSPHTRVYQKCLDYLKNCLQLDDVLSRLLAEGIITQRTYELVKRKQTNEGPTAASELFVMEAMLRDPDPGHFLRFVKLLEETKQDSIARRLRTEYKLIAGKELEAHVPTNIEMLKKSVPIRTTTRVVSPVVESGPQEQRHYVSKEGFNIESMDLAVAATKDEKSGNSMQPLPSVNIKPIDLDKIDINRNTRLGRGNIGLVFRGNLNGTAVAVKELGLPKKKMTEINQLLINEIIVSATVRHPNIVQFMGYSIDNQSNLSCLLLIYELIEGHNLDDILGDTKLIKKYDFNPAKRYRVLLQVSQALAYLHSQDRQIIHGDIKPANVMLTNSGDAKLCDLGLSKIKQNSNAASLVTTAAARGTPMYMAPEQLLFQKTSSTYSDVYAFGALIYEVLFEKYMWELNDDDLYDCQKLKDKMQAEKVPHKLKEMAHHPAHHIILKCVQFEYDQRPVSWSLVYDLQALCSGGAKSPKQIDPAQIDINRRNRLGRGNFGLVYRCDFNGTAVAVKELEIPTGKNKKPDISPLMNEISVSATVSHFNIVEFMGYSMEKQSNASYLLLVYELIDGHNLDDIISDNELIQKYDFNLAKRYRVLLQVSQALAYLHGEDPQIIHGDIKPANVMLTKSGDAKLCDLGLSKIKQNSNAASLVTTAAARGTPMYMAPEQLLFQKTSSTYSDVYAFGALIYEVLFEKYMWDLSDDDLNDRQKLKDKMQAEKVPHKLMEMAHHPACSIILKCVQFDYNQRSNSLSLVSEVQGLCNSCTESTKQV